MHKEEQVKRILLMPIVASKSVKGITLAKRYDDDSKFILSEQKYSNNVDEDMSDIAIEFYKTIYGKEIINKDGSLYDDQYAGDTMNSYYQIARRKKCSEEIKIAWFNEYHCLSNFWILPMEVGRKGATNFSKKKVSKDYMDGFLKILKERFDEYKSKYPNYFQDMNNIQDFYEYHRLEESGYIKNGKLEKITGFDCPNVSIEKMQDLVKSRAEYLSQEYGDKLYELFEKYSLILDK